MAENLIQLDAIGVQSVKKLYGTIENLKQPQPLREGTTRGEEGQIIFRSGDIESHHWTDDVDGRRSVRMRWQKSDGTLYRDATFNIDSGTQISTTHDFPPTQ